MEFSYYGVPAATPKEEFYTELVDGLRGSDPVIGSGSQVASRLFCMFIKLFCRMFIFLNINADLMCVLSLSDCPLLLDKPCIAILGYVLFSNAQNMLLYDDSLF